MKQFFDEIHAILAKDPGGRGVLRFAPYTDLDAVCDELSRMKSALIMTGFPIRVAEGEYCCETDGPLGAADMAYALAESGVKTSVVTDEADYHQVQAAVDARTGKVRTYLLKRNDPAAARRLIDDLAPTHILPIERPGKADDGHYHNARGLVIDDMLSDTDYLFDYAREKGAVSIAIGDGGNELGTGALHDNVARMLPGGEAIAACRKADYVLMAGVSNWWGWGMAALVSAVAGRDLMPTAGKETRLMHTVLDAGAVDGVTKEHAMSVDNLSFDENLAVLEALRKALHSYLERSGKHDAV